MGAKHQRNGARHHADDGGAKGRRGGVVTGGNAGAGRADGVGRGSPAAKRAARVMRRPKIRSIAAWNAAARSARLGFSEVSWASARRRSRRLAVTRPAGEAVGRLGSVRLGAALICVS